MDFPSGFLPVAPIDPVSLTGMVLGGLIAAVFALHLARWVRIGLPGLMEEAAARFEIAERVRDPEIDFNKEITADLGRLIAAERWELVHSLLAAWERDRARTPYGTMFHRIGAEVALEPLLDIAEAEAATGIRSSAEFLDAQVAAFEARMAAAPDDHVAATLAARAHLAAGWSVRGDGWRGAISPADLARMTRHYHSAERILSRFATRGSSLVAEARYFACLGLADGPDLIRRRYADWRALDPDDVTPFQVHGLSLLPRGFGSLAEVEDMARRSAEATFPAAGSAGYVIVHESVMACAFGETLPLIDPARFVRAALDRARTAGGQWGVNRMAELLMRMMLASRGDDRRTYRDGLVRLVHEHLRVLIPAAWPQPTQNVRRELARLFKAELESGARVRVTARGVEILPQAPDRATPAPA